MRYSARYSIGDMSQICNISKKALRYYDKIGLITSQRQDYNNYRYYTGESLLAVPVIKFYKQMGFTLEEMQANIEGDSPNIYGAIQKSFLAKIDELKAKQEQIQLQYMSVKDWYDLVFEAEMVVDNNIHEVSVKFVEPKLLLFQNQMFDNDIKASIINIDFTNYVEELHNAITGPVMINFSSYKDRIQQNMQKIRVLQQTLKPLKEEETTMFGGCMMATCYHIGSHENIHETYQEIITWARQHGYILGEDSVERYVTDYWTTKNCAKFVTEVMIKVSRPGAAEA